METSIGNGESHEISMNYKKNKEKFEWNIKKTKEIHVKEKNIGI
jgi:hypothetical protein